MSLFLNLNLPPKIDELVGGGGGGGTPANALQLNGQTLQLNGQDLALGA